MSQGQILCDCHRLSCPRRDTDVDQGYTIWKLMLQHHIWRGIHLNTAIDNLFNFKPKSYYYCSPLTTGTSFSIGLSVDLD